MNILGIIPSRYQSTRFPGKPLAIIDGKSMIQRVYERASQSKSLKKVVVATDDDRIFNHVKVFGGQAVMTSPKHHTGTERCAEALSLVEGEYDAVINIQGDEPFIRPEQIDLVAECLNEGTDIATLIKRITDKEDVVNPSIVKVILQGNKELLSFTRKLRFSKKTLESPEFIKNFALHKHIGIYGYKASVLLAIANLPTSPYEKLHSLEQLRWIENGYKIKFKETHLETLAVDTPEDLKRIIAGKFCQ